MPFPDTNSHISDLVVDATVLDLTALFATLVSTEQLAVVKGGNFQSNPLNKRLFATVHIGDPADDAWKDSSVARPTSDLSRSQFNVEAYEVGGGTMWWRRFATEFGFFGIKSKEGQDEARRIANITRGRVEKAIATSTRIPGLTDALGEKALMVLVVTSQVFEGGGPPASYIWRGVVQMQVLTHRNF